MTLLNSETRTVILPDGMPERIQTVSWDRWDLTDFVFPQMSQRAFDTLVSVYTEQMVKAFPWYFGRLHLFTGSGYSAVITGRRPFKHSPVHYTENTGFLSDISAQLAVNASFFTFDLLDCDSPYDVFGTPFGLMMKDNEIIRPPLYERACLLVDDTGRVTVKNLGIHDVRCSVEGNVYCRPEHRTTPRSSLNDIVIIGNRVIAVNPGGHTVIPSSGFVVASERTDVHPGDTVTYDFPGKYIFGIQGGTYAVKDGVVPEGFTSPFFHPFRPFTVSFPPARYPLDYRKDRAARIVLGARTDNTPVLFWFEGPAKPAGSSPSAGVSLAECGEILRQYGIYNAVHLDGGGSAQILLNGQRSLTVSGRDASGAEQERPVPAGLIIQ